MPRIFALAFLAALAATAARADSVEAMCTDRDQPEAQCTCAAEALAAELHEDDYALYEKVGTTFRENLEKEMDTGDAWEGAVRANKRKGGFIATLEITNRIGGMHARAIANCE